MVRSAYVVFAALVPLTGSFAQQSAPSGTPSFAGSWSGSIQIPAQPLAVQVVLKQVADAWQGTIDIPAQGAKALALEAILVEGTTVTFRITGVAGKPTFRGTLATEGAAIAGTFTQGGQKFPFTLTRAAAIAFGDLQAWLDETREKFHVPGCAVVVVAKGEPIATLMSGLRDVEKKLPVTPDTLFAIGSSTKAFTTLVLGTLVDTSELDWDKPVRTWIPDFALMDQSAGEHLTPRDLVTHRSGMPRHDLAWYGREFDRADMVHRLRYLPLNKDLRTEFQYNNLMLLTAGHLAERITGSTWETLVTERILRPLGMTRSNFSVVTSASDADHAEPYRRDHGAVKRVPFRDLTPIGPAGSINSSAREMAQWVGLHLSGGKHGERALVTPATLADLHRVRMPIADGGAGNQEIVSVGYALGWFVDVYRGHRRIHHGGNIDGFSALVAFLPDAGYGFVVLSNLETTPLPELVVRRFADRALGLEPKDYATGVLAKAEQTEKAASRAHDQEAFERKPGTKPSHALEDYVGEYEHKGYGVVRVTREGEALRIALHGLVAKADHWHYDVFRCPVEAPEPELRGTYVQFTSGLEGEIDALRIIVDAAVGAATFERRADAQLRDPAFLKRFVGEYEVEGQTATFALRGDKLTLALPGQFYELAPRRALAFELEGLTGYSVRFTLDAKGEVVGARFRQPEGVFPAKRKN